MMILESIRVFIPRGFKLETLLSTCSEELTGVVQLNRLSCQQTLGVSNEEPERGADPEATSDRMA